MDTSKATQEQLLRSGNGTSRSSSRGGDKGKCWRGVVEAAADVRLMIWPISGSLYIPGCWKSDKLVACVGSGHQSQEPMSGHQSHQSQEPRAEESFGTQEGGDTYHVIACRMGKSYLVYKVNLPVRPCSCKKWINDHYEKTDARGLGKATKVLRSASSSAIRRST